jgi:hypothetical protein
MNQVAGFLLLLSLVGCASARERRTTLEAECARPAREARPSDFSEDERQFEALRLYVQGMAQQCKDDERVLVESYFSGSQPEDHKRWSLSGCGTTLSIRLDCGLTKNGRLACFSEEWPALVQSLTTTELMEQVRATIVAGRHESYRLARSSLEGCEFIIRILPGPANGRLWRKAQSIELEVCGRTYVSQPTCTRNEDEPVCTALLVPKGR